MTTTALSEAREAAATEKNLSRSEWVYTGRRIGSDGRITYRWATYETPLFDDTHWFSKNIVRNPGVGAVYEVYVTNDDEGGVSVMTLGVNEPLYRERLDGGLVPEWEVEDQIAVARDEARKVKDRAVRESNPMGLMTLDDLTFRYQRLATADQRAGMVAAIIKYLERGR